MRILLAALVLLSAPPLAASESLRPYVYRVLDHQVVDGDTVRVRIDLGFHIRLDQLARLDGVDAPEAKTAAGQAVREYVTRWCAAQQTLLAVSVAQDKYAGRFVAELHGDSAELGPELLRLNLARIYDGGERREWTERELAAVEKAARAAIEGLGESDGDNTATDAGTKVQVWVTDSGEKYHRQSCRYCDDSGRAVDLAAVRGRMEPCKVCHPPE